jgi:hypothetical protein
MVLKFRLKFQVKYILADVSFEIYVKTPISKNQVKNAS